MNNIIDDEINALIDIANDENEEYDDRVEAAATLRTQYGYNSVMLRNENISEAIIADSGDDANTNAGFQNEDNIHNNVNNNATIINNNMYNANNSNAESELSTYNANTLDNTNWFGGARRMRKSKRKVARRKVKKTLKARKAKKTMRKAKGKKRATRKH